MRIALICLMCLCLSLSFTQNFHRCYTYEMMQEQETLTPGYMQSVNEAFDRAKNFVLQDRATVYTIPVVVHVVYKGSVENLPDSVIHYQIDQLNNAFRRTNADTVNLRTEFEPIVGDSYIRFELANTDPFGNPTNGITRTYSTHDTFYGVGDSPAEGVKHTDEGGVDPWDQESYLNIWICDMSVSGTPFIIGYGTPPNNLSNWPPGSTDNLSDGVVIHYEAIGPNNPNTIDMGGGPIQASGKSCVHEVGHYLGLRHIWGDGDCSAQDGIDDTPNADAGSMLDCDSIKNTCVDNIGTLGDLPDMVENYMDYSDEYCQNSFTNGQINLMRAIIEIYRAELIGGVSSANTANHKPFEFDLYPNPAHGTVKITGIPASVEKITIINNSGQNVYQVNNVSGSITISWLSKGIYFVRFSGHNGTVVNKLMVQ